MTATVTTRSSPPPGAPITRLAVLGAGTMGAGIAQLGIQVGCATVVFDPDPRALEAGAPRLETRILTDTQGRGWYEHPEDNMWREREPSDAPSGSPPADRGAI